MNPRNIGNFFKSKFGLFIVFVVVLVSVAFQGALVPHVAARLGVPMSRQSYE